MSALDKIVNYQDPVPEYVYDKAKSLIVPVVRYMEMASDPAKKAAQMVDAVRRASFDDYVVDGVNVSVRPVCVAVKQYDPSQVNIVTVDGVQYEHSVIDSVYVFISTTDAILVHNSFDAYEAVEDGDDFAENNTTRQISTIDVADILKPYNFSQSK